MTRKTPRPHVAARDDQIVPLLDLPPLGHLLYLVLDMLAELGPDACGLKVMEALSRQDDGSRVWVDHATIYSSIRKLLEREPPLIRAAGERPSPGGPPVKLYEVTPAGYAALRITEAHYEALWKHATRKRKRPRPK